MIPHQPVTDPHHDVNTHLQGSMGPYTSPYTSGAYPYPYSNSDKSVPLGMIHLHGSHRRSSSWGSGGTIPTTIDGFDDDGVKEPQGNPSEKTPHRHRKRKTKLG